MSIEGVNAVEIFRHTLLKKIAIIAYLKEFSPLGYKFIVSKLIIILTLKHLSLITKIAIYVIRG